MAMVERYNITLYKSVMSGREASEVATPHPLTGSAVQGGELDSVVAATLRRVIGSWEVLIASEVAHVFNVLDGCRVFEDLFVDRSKLVTLPGKKSMLTGQQVRDLEQAGISDRSASTMWTRVCNVVKAFTVLKPLGKLCLVVDASGVGEAQEDPPHVMLPSVSDVKGLVALYSYVTQLDGKSWFYQVPSRQLQATSPCEQ